jgi:hypothetical protein
MKSSIFLLACSTASCTAAQLHEYSVELFKTDPVSTEAIAYELLKKSPLENDVPYLAIPWAVLINTKKLNTIPDIKLTGGFTICQHISYEKIIPILKTIGIDVLFTPHVIRDKKYEGITVLPFPHMAVNGVEPAAVKDIFYSFIGATKTHWTRPLLLQLPKQDTVIIKARDDWHWYNKKQLQEREKEYQDVLARSRFSLCPRGTGASTIRFWESLQAGAIPILIADEMSLPDGIDWQQCIIQVAEKDTLAINELLKTISPEKELSLRRNCLLAYKQFSGENFISAVKAYYSIKGASRE